MTTPILKAENLVKCFGFWTKKTIVQDFTAQINAGEIVGFLGTNGAGKSTTFDMLSGLTKPTSGTISLFQPETNSWRVITNEPLYQRAKQGICYLPQKPSVFESLTTRQNLLGIMEIMSDDDLRSSMHAYDPSLTNREEFCDALLDCFDLLKLKNDKVKKLSGGEKRRLEIARSFIRKPKLILMDEPYAAVDLAGIELCGQMLRRVREMGVSILIIDHRVDEVLKLSNRVIFLNQGQIYAMGTPYEIVRIPLVQEKLLLTDTGRMLEMFPEPNQVNDEKSVSETTDSETTVPETTVPDELLKSKTVRMG